MCGRTDPASFLLGDILFCLDSCSSVGWLLVGNIIKQRSKCKVIHSNMEGMSPQEQAAAELRSIILLGTHTSQEKAWTTVYTIASSLPRSQQQNSTADEQLSHSVRDVVLYLLDKPQLQLAWAEVAQLSRTSRSSTTVVAEYSAQQLVTSYRWVANYFSTSRSSFPLTTSEMVHQMAMSFLDYVSSDDCPDIDRPVLVQIFPTLPTEFQNHLLECLRASPEKAIPFVSALSAERTLLMAVQLLRIGVKNNNNTTVEQSVFIVNSSHVEEHGQQQQQLKPLLQQLIERAVSGCHPFTVVDALLVQRPYANHIAAFVVSILPPDLNILIELTDLLVSLWGEKLFIARGDHLMQEYLTTSILSVLQRLTDKDLSEKGPSGCPLAVLITTGVSSYLDQSDTRSRIRGMKVARAFSRLLGREMVFDELIEEEKKQHAAATAAVVSVGEGGRVQRGIVSSIVDHTLPSSKSSAEKHNETSIHNGRHDSSSDDDDDDSDFDEIEAYDLGEEPFSNRVPETIYLRVCLTMLQAPEADTDAFDKQRVALHCIPRIVSSGPIDIR